MESQDNTFNHCPSRTGDPSLVVILTCRTLRDLGHDREGAQPRQLQFQELLLDGYT